MGVNGLWDITSPGARRIPLSVLEGRTVAVDASIWMAQFVKAMRDANGDLLRGAHLVGFFRRLCKLYYHRLKPIIVFDGPAPALKRRTLLERRRRREREEEELKKTAEKLVAQLVRRNARGRATGESDDNAVTLGDVVAGNIRPEEDIEMDALRKLLPRSENQGGDRSPSPESDVLHIARQRRRERDTYQSSVPTEFRAVFEHRRGLDELNVPMNLESLLKAPNAGKTNVDIQPSNVIRDVEEFKEFHIHHDGREEVIQIPLDCEIDESVFKALPASMQYKILVQLRAQWLIENRQKVVHAASQADPDVFSHVQIESYLRTVRTNDEIEKVKKVIARDQIKSSSGAQDPLEMDSEEVPVSQDDEGGFMQFYEIGEKAAANDLDLEDAILQDLETKQNEAEAEAQKLRDRIKARETGQANTKRLKLFNEWAEQQGNEPPPRDKRLLERAARWFNAGPDKPVIPQPATISPRRQKESEGLDSGEKEAPIDVDWDDELINHEVPEEEQQPRSPSPTLTTPVKHKIKMRRKGQTPRRVTFAENVNKQSPPERVERSEDENDWGDDDSWNVVEPVHLHEIDTSTLLKTSLDHVVQEEWSRSKPKIETKHEGDAAELAPQVKYERISPPSSPRAEPGNDVVQISAMVEIACPKQDAASPIVVTTQKRGVEEALNLDRDVLSGVRAEARSDNFVKEVSPSSKEKCTHVEASPKNSPEATPPSGGEKISSDSDGTSTTTAEPIRTSGQYAGNFFDLSENAFESKLRRGGMTRDDETAVLEEESLFLLKSLRKERQRAAHAGEDMMNEVRELLQCMGVPYVDAPGEAEAQCVELCRLSLAELVISDDSDCLVFGASEVIRHMFNSDTTVDLFTARDIERSLGLRVSDLRALALLLGCDYTLGITGVGMVNALEVVQAYGSDLAQLRAFAKWGRNKVSTRADVIEGDSELVKFYKEKHHNYRGGWDIPDEVPSEGALREFEKPRVDKSLEPFHWIIPDLDSVISLLSSKANVPAEKTHQLLSPVLERLRTEDGGVTRRQTLLETFFEPAAPEDQVGEYRSTRMKKAIEKIHQHREQRRAAAQPKRGNQTARR